jgi:hypothetical protein
MELESRLIKSENLFYAQYLLPRVIGNITNEQIATLVIGSGSLSSIFFLLFINSFSTPMCTQLRVGA